MSGFFRQTSDQPVLDEHTRLISHGVTHGATQDSAQGAAYGEPGNATPLPIGTRLQEFEITDVIGIGGFGIVYLARDLSLQRFVAIKEFMPAQLAVRHGGEQVTPRSRRCAQTFELGRGSFLNEARLLAQFKHRGLVEVLRFWEQHGTAYMVMPYYEGETLKQFLKRSPEVVNQEWLRATMRPLLDALEHMHRADCYHRDVAPDNILILADGSPILLDLGAARQVIGDHAQALTVMLKPGFAPIEQYAEDPLLKQAAWTDVYALGAVAYFTITGKVPTAAASRVLRDHLPSLMQLRPLGFDETLLQAIDHAMAIRPEDRPQSIARFRAALYAGCDVGASGLDSQAAAEEAASAIFPPTITMSRSESSSTDAADVDKSTENSTDKSTEKPTEKPSSVGDQVDEAMPSDPAVKSSRTSSLTLISLACATCVVLACVWWLARGDGGGEQSGDAISQGNNETSQVAATAKPVQAPTTTANGPAQISAAAAAAAVAPSVDALNGAALVNGDKTSDVSAAAVSDPGKPAAAEPVVTGVVRLNVTPWAQVFVDGESKGASPPLKQLTLPVGRHRVELRNPAGNPVKLQIDLQKNSPQSISHQF